jgi:hypothetical protein
VHTDPIIVAFALANVIIAMGYASIPVLVLPHLGLVDRWALGFGGGFFLLCGTTHAGMALGLGLGHDHTSGAWLVFWAVEHVAQAVCTWGFILRFHRLLAGARARLQRGEVRVVVDAAPELGG